MARTGCSQVRIHCFLGQTAKARALVESSQNKAGAHYLAMQYENQDRFQGSQLLRQTDRERERERQINAEQHFEKEVCELDFLLLFFFFFFFFCS